MKDGQALTGHGHAGRHERRHRDDPAGFTDLEIGRIEIDIGIGGLVERTPPEGLDLGVERRADPADFAAADAGDTQTLHEVVDPAGRDPKDVCLLDDRKQGSLGSPARFEQARKVVAVADARDRQIDRADTGVPASVSIAVAAREAAVGCSFALGHAGQFGYFGFHHALREQVDGLAQEVAVAFFDRLANAIEQSHAVVGHRGVPFVVGFSVPTTRG
jgi:hypothetical protein